MESIGGYFSLELNEGRERHPHALRLNAGRYALEYILKARMYRKVYLPYYICDSVLQPIKRQGVEYEFYHINEQLEPATELHLKDDEAVLYVNYFGLKEGDPVHKYRDVQDCVGELLLKYENADQMNEIIENMDKYVRILVK